MILVHTCIRVFYVFQRFLKLKFCSGKSPKPLPKQQAIVCESDQLGAFAANSEPEQKQEQHEREHKSKPHRSQGTGLLASLKPFSLLSKPSPAREKRMPLELTRRMSVDTLHLEKDAGRAVSQQLSNPPPQMMGLYPYAEPTTKPTSVSGRLHEMIASEGSTPQTPEGSLLVPLGALIRAEDKAIKSASVTNSTCEETSTRFGPARTHSSHRASRTRAPARRA